MASRNTPPPAPDPYEPIRRAIRADQQDTAREMLRPILTGPGSSPPHRQRTMIPTDRSSAKSSRSKIPMTW